MFFCLIWGKWVCVALLSFAMPLKADGEQSSGCPEGPWIKPRSNPLLSHLVHTFQNFVCPLRFYWSQKEFPEQTVCDISLQVSYNVVSRSGNRQQDNKKLKLFFRALTLPYTSIVLTSAQDRCINKEFCHQKLLELLASPTSEKNFGVIENILGFISFIYLHGSQMNRQHRLKWPTEILLFMKFQWSSDLCLPNIQFLSHVPQAFLERSPHYKSLIFLS